MKKIVSWCHSSFPIVYFYLLSHSDYQCLFFCEAVVSVGKNRDSRSWPLSSLIYNWFRLSGAHRLIMHNLPFIISPSVLESSTRIGEVMIMSGRRRGQTLANDGWCLFLGVLQYLFLQVLWASVWSAVMMVILSHELPNRLVSILRITGQLLTHKLEKRSLANELTLL